MMDKFMATANAQPLSWRFPAVFWIANFAELLERAAYYGMFITVTLFLTDVVGFNDIHTSYLVAAFSASIYLFPTFSGAIADKIGFRPALILAFALLSVGYGLLGALPTKAGSIFSLCLVVAGGSFVKPVILGTAAKCSNAQNRARAFSLFYWTVNIGGFTGKTVAAPLREHLGLVYINYYASAMAFLALVWVALFFRPRRDDGPTRTLTDVISGFWRVLRNGRFMALILIVSGFWMIQGQIYAAMPKYILRLLGDSAKPEWLANVNPFVVVLGVVPITHLIRNMKPENTITIALFIVPFAALAMSLSPMLEAITGSAVSFGYFSFHPVTVMVIVGIVITGFAECFLSPKFFEYASKQAPPGEEGLYMGFQNLTVFFAWSISFSLSGHLIDAFFPDPKTLPPETFAQWKTAIETGSALPIQYAHAHYIWYIYAVIGAAAFVALCIFRWYTHYVDQRAELNRTGLT